jgi:hypothetical protein
MDTKDLRIRIFLSWSGQDSHDLAIALRSWLHDVNQLFTPWISQLDISKGQRWNSELVEALRTMNQGIICVTPDNLNSRWMHFEAGALIGSAPADVARVHPVRLGLSSDQLTGPLTTFQGTDAASENDMLMLAQSLNESSPEPLPADRLKRSFARCWSDYRDEVMAIHRRSRPPTPTRSTDDMVKEILDTVRALHRANSASTSPAATTSMPRLSLMDE